MPKAKEQGRVITTMRFDPKLLDRLDKQAKKEGRTRSNLIEYLLTQGLSRRDKGKGGDNVFG